MENEGLKVFSFHKNCGLLLVTVLSLSSSTALEWSSEGSHRWAKLADPGKGKPGFTLMPPKQTGVQFTNTLSTAILIGNKNLLNGSGVALGDYDGDGLCDIYLSRLEGDNALYRNLGGWQFKDVTAAIGTACPSQFSTGSVFADVMVITILTCWSPPWASPTGSSSTMATARSPTPLRPPVSARATAATRSH